MDCLGSFLLFVLVLNCVPCAQTGQRSGSIGCSFDESVCNEDEYCSKVDQPYGQCQKIQYRNKKEDGDLPDITYEDFRHFQNLNRGLSNEKKWQRSEEDAAKYDMTYFGDDDDDEPVDRGNIFDQTRNGEHKEMSDRHGYQFRRFQPSSNERSGIDSDYEHGRTLKRHKTSSRNEWPPMEIPIFPEDVEKKRLTHHSRRTTAESDEIGQSMENEGLLDLDVEIKPLSKSVAQQFDEERTKLSHIPKKPATLKEQQIEHVQTNIVGTSALKKTKVGMLIGGKLNEAKAKIVHETSRDKTYAQVKDFFKSQQVSSIVDVPLAEKKEGYKFYSLAKEDKNVDVKRDTIPHPSIHPRAIRLHVEERLNTDKAGHLVNTLEDLLYGRDIDDKSAFTSVRVKDKIVLFHMINNTTTSGEEPASVVERINRDTSLKRALNKAAGVKVVSASLQSEQLDRKESSEDGNFMVTTLVVAGCVTGVLLASVCIFIIVKRNQQHRRWIIKPAGQEAASDYQSLWRQLRQATWDAPIQTPPVADCDNSDTKTYFAKKGLPGKYSWSEEPVDTNMDISTGHVVLAYMEDHLQNADRLSKEWEDLDVYEAEPNEANVGKDQQNGKKNRYSDVLPYDHNRVKLRETSNATGSDYINASYIIDDDPRNPAYIAAQGPLGSTVADFWQMVWEQGVVVIVMLTKLADLGLPQCHRYWPEKGNDIYHIYQVHLISEHIWCSDYLVRSFYLKNVQTGETRTVTQFHFLTWPHLGIPASSKPLLDFRRKVLKCFRNQSSPVLVHCSGGIDRTGTYILIDMVLRKMSKGTKEIDIAATLEHLRDQRPDMVKTRIQFEFALTSVAEEVNAILQVLTKH